MYKAAVIGCGRVGCSFDDDPLRKVISTHARAYYENPKTELYALCDVDKSKLVKYGKRYSVDHLFTSVDDLLAKTKPDLISICTLPETHEEITIKAAKAGVKGIFCEKPIATSISAAKKMIKICEKNDVVLLIDHQRRFDPLFSKLKNEINNGLLGSIYQSTFYYTAGIFNTGTHVIDLMRYLFGDVEWVIGKNSIIPSPNPEDPNIDGMLAFKNGIFAGLHALDVKDYLIFEQDILGSKGRLRILSSGFELEYYGVSDSRYFSGYKEMEKLDLPFEAPKERQYMLEAINHLVNCIENKTNSISSGDDGVKALETILALIKSAKNSSKKTYLSQ